MPQGVQKRVLTDLLLALERVVTVLSAAFNLWYFLGYRARTKGRRIGALVLALVNLTFMAGAIYPITLLSSSSFGRLDLAVGFLPMASALIMTALIWRQWSFQRRSRGNEASGGKE